MSEETPTTPLEFAEMLESVQSSMFLFTDEDYDNYSEVMVEVDYGINNAVQAVDSYEAGEMEDFRRLVKESKEGFTDALLAHVTINGGDNSLTTILADACKVANDFYFFSYSPEVMK